MIFEGVLVVNLNLPESARLRHVHLNANIFIL